MVDLASIATLAGDTRLALALPGLDVALAVGGAQRVAVAPGGGTDEHQAGTQRWGTGKGPLQRSPSERSSMPSFAKSHFSSLIDAGGNAPRL